MSAEGVNNLTQVDTKLDQVTVSGVGHSHSLAGQSDLSPERSPLKMTIRRERTGLDRRNNRCIGNVVDPKADRPRPSARLANVIPFKMHSLDTRQRRDGPAKVLQYPPYRAVSFMIQVALAWNLSSV